jgi:hypothetical protein
MTNDHVRALTVRQPWAALITAGVKIVENRTWPPHKGFRGPLLIHAAAKHDLAAWDHDGLGKALGDAIGGDYMPISSIVAVATRITSHRDEPGTTCSTWAFEGCWHWDLHNVVALPEPVPCTGRLGLWTPDEATLDQVRHGLADLPIGTPEKALLPTWTMEELGTR